MNFDCKKIALFAGGALFGSAGIKLLTSKDAKRHTPMPLPLFCG